jgi:hypothetical protein
MPFEQKRGTRPSAQAGFAIGPILFVLALLALIGGIMAASGGGFGSASIIDRVAADISSQTNLMRNVVNECNAQYLSFVKLKQTEDSTYVEDSDPFPHSAAGGTLASALLCDPLGTQSLWANVAYPPLPLGFNNWMYMDASSSGGGRCVYITPTVKNNGILDGLTKASLKFTVQSSCNNSGTPCSSEVIYDPSSASLKFALWITLPTGTPDSHCMP